ncbi:hypothetical protein [Stenotrophomonas sp. CFBP8994]|uniref:hypothetical protein n=1 Tax=Stenotrophomonas sp. CFBP8994 TaxID=3096527 RepID=UPI002A6AECD9|nr:hypothetical protein [Stenotrophomonas sp. CFBP8994]MDY0978892.1 hypothetical protein [Stenotrophomonas sp. CFBP8994]
MSFWNAFSTCWPPGQGGCVVWWDAWAAVGTIGAAVIALWLGLQPVFGRRRHAKAVARIAGIRLGIQILHLGASCHLAKSITTASHYNATRINAEHCDSKPLALLIPYFDVLPRSLINLLAECISDIDTLHALLDKGSYWPPKSPPPTVKLSGLLDGLFSKMTATHAALCKYVGVPLPDLHQPTASMGKGLSDLADLAELAGWEESVTRQHILGRRT